MYDNNKIELMDIKLESLSFELHDKEKTHKGGSVEFESNLLLDSKHSDDIRILRSEIKVIGKSSQGENIFTVEAHYYSAHQIVDIKKSKKLTKEQLADCLISMIYTIIRDDVMQILSRAGLRQIALPFHMIKD